MAWRPTRQSRARRIVRAHLPADRARQRARARVASPMMETLGGVAVAVVILYGGHQVIEGARTPGRVLLLHHRAAARLSAAEEPGRISMPRCRRGWPRRSASSPCSTSSRRSATGPAPRRCASPAARSASTACASPIANGTRALDGVVLVVPAGRTVALVGASGAGKIDDAQPDPALLRCRRRAACRIDGQDVRDVTLPRCAARSRW